MDAWIDRALERLEHLEAEREVIAAQGPSAAATLAEYDTEIAALYEVLEAAADDADGDNELEPAPALELVPVPQPTFPAVSPTAQAAALPDAPAPDPIPTASPDPIPTASPQPTITHEPIPVASAQPVAQPIPLLAAAAPSAPMIVAAATAAPAAAQPGVPELFLGDQNTLTYIEHVGWTTFRDLEPLPAAAATPAPPPVVPDAAVADYAVEDAWNGGSLGWKWMVPVAAALLLFVVIGAVIGMQPSDAVEGQAVATAPEPNEAPAPAAAAQDEDKKARWAAIASTPIGAEVPPDTQEPQAAVGATDVTVTPPSKPAVTEAPKPAPKAKPTHKKNRRHKTHRRTRTKKSGPPHQTGQGPRSTGRHLARVLDNLGYRGQTDDRDVLRVLLVERTFLPSPPLRSRRTENVEALRVSSARPTTTRSRDLGHVRRARQQEDNSRRLRRAPRRARAQHLRCSSRVRARRASTWR